MIQSLVVFSWNGKDEPLAHVVFDAAPSFDILLFNYSGNEQQPVFTNHEIAVETLSIKTAFKGEWILEVCKHVKSRPYCYIGLMDDDLAISVSNLNRLLQIAAEINADVFQPAVKKGSHYSHAQFLQKQGSPPEAVAWVEIMAPFLRKEIFEAGEQFYTNNISSYGVDRYLFPYLQRKLNQSNTFLIHEVAIAHLKAVTDGGQKFSNGLDARQEGELLRKKILERIKEEKIPFTDQEMKSIFEVGVLRWQKWKYDLKRILGR
jgi:hypothetical protein